MIQSLPHKIYGLQNGYDWRGEREERASWDGVTKTVKILFFFHSTYLPGSLRG